MKFGPCLLEEAEGCVLAHAWTHAQRTRKKGHRLTAEDIRHIGETGQTTVIVARLDQTDVHEDQAATLIAEALVKTGESGLLAREAFTGRVNLHAAADGLVVIDRDRINAANAVHESLTIATLPAGDMATEGQMIATIKIIPFAVDEAALHVFIACLEGSTPAIAVLPWQPYRAHLVQTTLPATRSKVLQKTRRITDQRLAESMGEIITEQHCAHEASALAQALETLPDDDSLIMVFGASAITDRRDVIPSAIDMIGGEVLHLGMPVDPGNLLLLGELRKHQVIGIPGCARSPKLNGFDFVLRRHAARLATQREDIMAMGVGGLLTEIPLRAQPRDPVRTAPSEDVAVLILAAGMSRRMGDLNKLILPIAGMPMIRHVVERYRDAGLSRIHVVTGHEDAMIREALDDIDIQFVHNSAYETGQASSLRAGIESLPESVQACLIGLGDTPALQQTSISDVLKAYAPAEGRTLVVPMHDDRPAHPVLFDRCHFHSLVSLDGDQGAGAFIRRRPVGIHMLSGPQFGGGAADLDTMDDYLRWLGDP